MPEPTKDDICDAAGRGYSWPRLAQRYGIGIKRMKTIARQWPEIESKIIANGKKRTQLQKIFGCYRGGCT
jgi:hypothetical protein